MSENTNATETNATDTRVYDSAVIAGRKLVATRDRNNWSLGDLAVKIETTYGASTIKRFADDIGYTSKTLYDLRYVSNAYAKDDRSPGNTWTVHQVFAREDDRSALVASKIWSVADARELVKSRKATETGATETGATETGATETGATETEIERTRRHIAQLESQLANAKAKLAQLEAQEAAATKATKPAATKATKPAATKATKPATDAKGTAHPLQNVTAASTRARHARNRAA